MDELNETIQDLAIRLEEKQKELKSLRSQLLDAEQNLVETKEKLISLVENNCSSIVLPGLQYFSEEQIVDIIISRLNDPTKIVNTNDLYYHYPMSLINKIMAAFVHYQFIKIPTKKNPIENDGWFWHK